MKVDKVLIEHVAKVSRLKLTEEEIEEFLPQLKEVIKAFSEIQEVDTVGISPMLHPVEIKDAVREDVVGDCLSQHDALKGALHKEGYIKGPKVV